MCDGCKAAIDSYLQEATLWPGTFSHPCSSPARTSCQSLPRGSLHLGSGMHWRHVECWRWRVPNDVVHHRGQRGRGLRQPSEKRVSDVTQLLLLRHRRERLAEDEAKVPRHWPRVGGGEVVRVQRVQLPGQKSYQGDVMVCGGQKAAWVRVIVTSLIQLILTAQTQIIILTSKWFFLPFSHPRVSSKSFPFPLFIYCLFLSNFVFYLCEHSIFYKMNMNTSMNDFCND